MHLLSEFAKEGEFPKPIKLGRSSRWFKSEIEQWLKERINSSKGK
ncbi:helix-turn-helix transcriptional regulator [Providencia vermicola]